MAVLFIKYSKTQTKILWIYKIIYGLTKKKIGIHKIIYELTKNFIQEILEFIKNV